MTSKGKLPLSPLSPVMKKVCFPNNYCTKKLSFSPVIFYLLRDDFVDNYVKSAISCGRIREVKELMSRKKMDISTERYIRRNI
jgi:hypothetical protein